MSLSVSQTEPKTVSPRAASHLFHLRFLGSEALVLVLLAALAIVVKGHPGPLPADVGMELDVQRALLHSPLAGPLEAVSTLNWPTPAAITLAVIVVIFLVLRRWLDAIIVLVAAGVSSLATYELSTWVHRHRPIGYGIHPVQQITGTYSFPSGHVAYAVTVFGLFLFLSTQLRHALHPALDWLIRVVLVALIVLMPISRLLEGEHWPSDVLGGALDGIFWLVAFAYLYLWMRRKWPRLLARDER